ncbi:hypothetical protein [Mucilaginibacter celer]|uniref:Uncharacterized protein n=1 Tax=Mucilaginibacter celer TaxID=2305508 RepID=A0A494VQY6_9SPHI|nr:hypothetical protein [Mucilaginibacter celer]AYL98007.1 hypothetical protein HYN43_023150 [Mucilaginibacter celer]
MNNDGTNRRWFYSWPALFVSIVIVLFFILIYSVKNKNKTPGNREITAPDLLKLINSNPADYTTELNKIIPGWTFNPDKNRWINPQRQSALAIRMNELRLMEPVKYYNSFSTYLESHNFNLISISAPAGTSKATKKIFENNDYIFTIEADGQYVMISLAGR